LRQVYQDAMTKKYGFPRGWLANWPAEFDRLPGQVGEIDDDTHTFNKDGELADYGITATADSPSPRPDGPWEYTSGADIKIEIGVDASAPGMGFIGNAEAGLKIGFGRERGLVLAIASAHEEGLRNIDQLKRDLVAAAEKGDIGLHKVVIVQQLVGDSGLLVTSEGNSAELAATTNADVGGAGKPTLATFGLDFHLANKSQEVAEHSFPNGFTVAFRAVKLGKRGWFWWREIVAEGIVAVTEDDEEALLERDDYFAPLPDAEFSSLS
jgi:hypothetical protein